MVYYDVDVDGERTGSDSRTSTNLYNFFHTKVLIILFEYLSLELVNNFVTRFGNENGSCYDIDGRVGVLIILRIQFLAYYQHLRTPPHHKSHFTNVNCNIF